MIEYLKIECAASLIPRILFFYRYNGTYSYKYYSGTNPCSQSAISHQAMKQRTATLLSIALFTFLLISFLLAWNLDINTTRKRKIKYLYMLQTESCLSEYLREVIGDPSICPCNVSVLSFKTRCDQPPPLNVKYIFTGRRTSWGGGRNVLYEEAMKREQEYLYFIIMDDDISINREWMESRANPWRRFEEFLERVEPAAAAIDIVDKLWLRRAANGRQNLGCTSRVNESAEYLSVARYDAAFNAFHNKTIRNILPYTLKFDYISWIFAPMYVNIKIELLYAGHSVLHNKIFATNPTHRPYPKEWPNTEQWNAIVDEAANELPPKYRNSGLIQGWRRNGTRHEQSSPTICLPPPPPKMPIREFAYIDGILDSLHYLTT